MQNVLEDFTITQIGPLSKILKIRCIGFSTVVARLPSVGRSQGPLISDMNSSHRSDRYLDSS